MVNVSTLSYWKVLKLLKWIFYSSWGFLFLIYHLKEPIVSYGWLFKRQNIFIIFNLILWPLCHSNENLVNWLFLTVESKWFKPIFWSTGTSTSSSPSASGSSSTWGWPSSWSETTGNGFLEIRFINTGKLGYIELRC